MEVLSRNGYQQGKERFQYHKKVMTDIGPVNVRVDFLTPVTDANAPGRTCRTNEGLDALPLRGGHFAFAETVEREVEGRLPDGERDVLSVRVTSTVPFLVLKSLSLWDRRERKDAYDIYHRLKNYPGDLEDLVEEFEPYMETELVREGLDILTKCFAHLYSEGPQFVADFMAPEHSEERAFLKRDSYELVRFLLEELDSRRAGS